MTSRFRTFSAKAASVFTPVPTEPPPKTVPNPRPFAGSILPLPTAAGTWNAIVAFVLSLLVSGLVLVAFAASGAPLRMEALVIAIVGPLFVGIIAGWFGGRIVNGALYEAAGILFAPYGVRDEHAAVKLLQDYVLLHNAPILLITDGKVDPRSHDSPMLKLGKRGPGYVRVDDMSAVLIQHTIKHDGNSDAPDINVTENTMRVLTLGQYFLNEHDTIRGMVELKLHEDARKLENVITKDGIPLSIHLRLYFRIAQNEGYLLRSGSYHASGEAVKLAILTSTDWKLQTVVSAESRIRDYFARFNFNQIQGIYPTSVGIAAPGSPDAPREAMQSELRRELNKAVGVWGAEITALAIDEISIPKEVKDTLSRAWKATWENKIEFEKADTEARVQQRTSEGNREAAIIDHEANLTIAKTLADSEKIKSQSRGETVRTQAEAQIASVQQLLQVLKENNIPPDSALAQKILDLFKTQSGRFFHRGRDGRFWEFDPDDPSSDGPDGD